MHPYTVGSTPFHMMVFIAKRRKMNGLVLVHRTACTSKDPVLLHSYMRQLFCLETYSSSLMKVVMIIFIADQVGYLHKGYCGVVL